MWNTITHIDSQEPHKCTRYSPCITLYASYLWKESCGILFWIFWFLSPSFDCKFVHDFGSYKMSSRNLWHISRSWWYSWRYLEFIELPHTLRRFGTHKCFRGWHWIWISPWFCALFRLVSLNQIWRIYTPTQTQTQPNNPTQPAGPVQPGFPTPQAARGFPFTSEHSEAPGMIRIMSSWRVHEEISAARNSCVG